MQTKQEKSFGVIPVFKNPEGGFLFCLVKHAEGHWSFPKGTPDIGESEKETAIRELREETGIEDIKLLDNDFIEEYAFEQDGIIHEKFVKYFLGFTSSIDTTTLDEFKKENPELRWVNYEDAKQLITFKEAKEILEQVFSVICSTI